MTGDGIDRFLTELGAKLAEKYAEDMSEPPLITEARHRHLLQHVLTCLDTLAEEYLDDIDPDLPLAAEEVRHAAYLLGQITGETIGADEVLGGIFARFCIGK